jgi:hypothetical protein
MDMRYHWLTDRVRHKKIDVYWRPGRENLGDYHKKHNSAQHHKDMRGLILHQANSLQVPRGRVKLLPLPQPPLRARTDARTNPKAQRATQLRSVLARVYAVETQNQITTAKLLPLPQPPVRARTDARTNPSAQRATQLRSVLARVYAVSIQNQSTTTFP